MPLDRCFVLCFRFDTQIFFLFILNVAVCDQNLNSGVTVSIVWSFWYDNRMCLTNFKSFFLCISNILSVIQVVIWNSRAKVEYLKRMKDNNRLLFVLSKIIHITHILSAHDKFASNGNCVALFYSFEFSNPPRKKTFVFKFKNPILAWTPMRCNRFKKNCMQIIHFWPNSALTIFTTRSMFHFSIFFQTILFFLHFSYFQLWKSVMGALQVNMQCFMYH